MVLFSNSGTADASVKLLDWTITSYNVVAWRALSNKEEIVPCFTLDHRILECWVRGTQDLSGVPWWLCRSIGFTKVVGSSLWQHRASNSNQKTDWSFQMLAQPHSLFCCVGSRSWICLMHYPPSLFPLGCSPADSPTREKVKWHPCRVSIKGEYEVELACLASLSCLFQG